MVGLLVAVALAILCTPVIAVIGLINANAALRITRNLETRLRALERNGVVPRSAALPEPASPAPVQRAPAAEPAPPLKQEETPAPPQPALAAATSIPAVTAAPSAVPPPPPLSPAPSRSIGFEERFGTRWVVWVGGVALALGGIFLVRYSIQEGLIGPGMRIMLGAVLALALVAAGEWQRRKENLLSLPSLPSANIPSILTAAGTTVAYATVYAAYALYGFLPPPIAFILLGIVALLTLSAALLHGPVLAGLGVIGAYLAPMLVASKAPDFWALYVYVAVINAAAFALARLRLWYYLALAALVLGALWALPGIDLHFPSAVALNAHVFHALSGFALAAI